MHVTVRTSVCRGGSFLSQPPHPRHADGFLLLHRRRFLQLESRGQSVGDQALVRRPRRKNEVRRLRVFLGGHEVHELGLQLEHKVLSFFFCHLFLILYQVDVTRVHSSQTLRRARKERERQETTVLVVTIGEELRKEETIQDNSRICLRQIKQYRGDEIRATGVVCR